MNTRNLYGVFVGTMFGMTSSKRKAIQFAKPRQGIVMVIRGGMGNHWRSVRAWDAPTFKATADTIADYRLQQPSKPC